MGKSAIPYVDYSWNVTRGCQPVSEGCRHCWAVRSAIRMATRPTDPYHGLVENDGSGPRWTGRADFVESELKVPLHWRAPRRVFVCSMSDLFHPDLTDEQIGAVFAVMGQASDHHFLVLTKRVARLVEWAAWAELGFAQNVYGSGHRYGVRNERAWKWPPRNVTLIASVEDQESADARLPQLLAAPAKTRGLSMEPLLGPVALDPDQLVELDWVIVGAESGPGHRPMELDWVRSIRDQCVEAGTAFYFKQAYEAGRRVDAPCLDGVLWREIPDPRSDP